MQKAIVFSLLVGVTMAQLLANPAPAVGGAANALNGGAAAGAAGAAGAAASPFGGLGLGVKGNPYGPRVYGMGLNNPWSVPPNQFLMNQALALIQNVPGALIRVDPNGEINFTNQFGQEVDITDRFGNELSDLYEF